MKSHYSLEQLQSVVPVECAGRKGTAFFISDTQLLTARHIVVSALRNASVKSLVTIGGDIYSCDSKELSSKGEPIDIAILTLKEEIKFTPHKFTLLCCDINEDWNLCMVGFPSELGNNEEQFTIRVAYEKIMNNDSNMLLRREDPLAFAQYYGFSGSPILDTEGNVHGIVVAQNNRALQAIPINQAEKLLHEQNILISYEGERADMTRIGLGRSIKLLQDSIKRVGNRYQKDVYQKDEGLMKKIKSFLDYQKAEKYQQIYEEAWSWADSNKNHIKDETLDQNIPLEDLIAYLKTSADSYNKNKKMKKKHKEATYYYKHLKDYLYDAHEITKQFFCIRSCAGYGKTSATCAIAEEYCNEHNVYLLFGSQFSSTSVSAIEQICNIVGFQSGDLDSLNNDLRKKKHYALLIIDAINEGAGYSYWKNNHQPLISELSKYKNVKLLITVRDNASGKFIEDYFVDHEYIDYSLTGFSNTHQAIRDYFNKYHIPMSIIDGSENLFVQPLFLSIFCQSYHFSALGNRKANHLNLYTTYLRKRNEEISRIVDEDEERNITSEYLLEIARHSVFECYCGYVSRKQARQIADKICPRELWSNNLLKACLDENLLMPVENDIYSPNPSTNIMFDFDNLGDFLKAISLYYFDWSVDEIMTFIRVQREKIKSLRSYMEYHFSNMLTALLGIWEKEDITKRKDFSTTFSEEEIIGSLPYNGSLNKSIREFLFSTYEKHSLDIILNYFHHFDNDFVESISTKYKDLPMNKRDIIIALSANKLYEEKPQQMYSFLKEIKTYSVDEVKSLGILLCWLLSSSHPEMRAITTRRLMILMEENLGCNLIEKLNSMFYNIDDPYILQGLYAAMYGVTLRTRDGALVEKIAKIVYDTQFKNNFPIDLIVREWTLKIIERAHILNSESPYWDKIRPPFDNTPNPLNWGDVNVDEHYFGEDDGSKKIYWSLFDSGDFERYVIGTNNNMYSHQFYLRDKGKATSRISLESITKMIAYCIKNVLGWNSDLGNNDKGLSSPNRFENRVERLGKKYQWIAYYRVMALLSDHCNVKKWDSSKKNEFLNHPYPWQLEHSKYFDPTLVNPSEYKFGEFNEFDDVSIHDNVSPYKYFKDNNLLPQLHFSLENDKGEEWILLMGIQGDRKELGEKKCIDVALGINSVFVRNEDSSEFSSWAKLQNFHGRWMLEDVDGGNNFLWNEYPCAHSYKSNEYSIWEPSFGTCPTAIMLSYRAQRQEDILGIHDENFPYTAYAPCEEIMEFLKLHTAERGVVRSEDEEIVTINRYPYVDIKHEGLLIRKEFLLRFMNEKKYSLFFYVWGEKLCQQTRYYLANMSGCFQLCGNGTFEDIQSLHVN